jgi:hypothetical protein
MIKKFKIYEKFDDGYEFYDKAKKLFNEFVELYTTTNETLYSTADYGVYIQNDDYILFKCGNESEVGVDPFRRDYFFIGYQDDCITNIFGELVILEKYIIRKLQEYIEIDIVEDDGIKFQVFNLRKLKDVQFDIEDVKIEMEANKFNL